MVKWAGVEKLLNGLGGRFLLLAVSLFSFSGCSSWVAIRDRLYQTNLVPSSLDAITFFFGLVIVTLAAKEIGRGFERIKLPLITGFLVTGVIAGPYMLDLLSEGAVKKLKFVEQISLAYIAFSAGSELYLKEFKPRYKSIKWTTVGVVASTFVLGSVAVFLLSEHIPFMSELPKTSKIGISLLAGSILVARSPSSAMAVIRELRAKGPFTQTAIGVTVVSDVVVIILFAINSSITDALLSKVAFDFNFILLLTLEFVGSFLLSIIASRIIKFALIAKIHSGLKIFSTILVGYAVFVLAEMVREYTEHSFAVEVFLEPLLICMLSGFILANHTPYRDDFLGILHKIGPTIYLIFFTLTGASLSLDLLGELWHITLLIVVIRMVTIFIGAAIGGMVAGDPMSFNRISWMTFITQAGIGMGLAAEVSVSFPDWGEKFATLMISVIVVNQLVGPSFFKMAIYLAKEAFPKASKTEPGIIQNAVIFGSDGQAYALARQLASHNWQVKVACPRSRKPKKVVGSDIEVHPMADLSTEELRIQGVAGAGAIVAMLSDEENLEICENVSANFESINKIVHVSERENQDKFKALGALIVDQDTSIISLLDHYVRTPSAVSMFLGSEKNNEILEIELGNPSLYGLQIRHLRLPFDVLIIAIKRKGQKIDVHGNVILRRGDVVIAAGPWKSLEDVALRLER